MTPSAFVAKWRHVALSERAAAQTHFIDLCALVGHQDPVAADPAGTWFTFERGATKATGGEGWADVWKRGFFGFEYKGKHKDLDAAYWQLLKYQGALENPPLLVACDTDRIVIHTHFANTPTKTIVLTLEGLVEPDQFAVLRAVFHDPERLRPEKTIQQITEEAAGQVTEIAQRLRARSVAPERVARFLDRVVFCMFAEDVGLLPSKVFSRVIENTQGNPARFKSQAAALFECMAHGGDFGPERIEHFNGNLFDATEALDLTTDELKALQGVSALDWSNIDPSIFGTLFERALDPDKRSQLGAHYTSREDIETLVDPVVMKPLRAEWEMARKRIEALKAEIERILATAGHAGPTTGQRRTIANRRENAAATARAFLDRLASVTILDPACGSGNFLYVVLQRLKDLEKDVILAVADLQGFFPQVGPWQLHGIEVNRYAHELAQMTVWIGHLQWHQKHGMGLEERPILRPMDNIECRDAIIALDEKSATEPEWPAADFIVSNPPFLGTKKLRSTLGDAYVDRLFALYEGRIPNFSDLVCYWFEKARDQVASGKAVRAGLLATQGIRGGLNREVLHRIKQTGDIFFAISDKEWVLDGANVHISMIGFDDGRETERLLDGRPALSINADLTEGADLSRARRLQASRGVCFYADVKAGSFDIERDVATAWLLAPNPHGRPNSDVIVPWANGLDVIRRPRGQWVVDFPSAMSETEAAKYELPFDWVLRHVRPSRLQVKRRSYRDYWWIHAEPCDAMRTAVAPLVRFIVTPSTAKFRVFEWMSPPTLPDHQLMVVALATDVAFGILHSRIHEVWALRKGSRLETRPRYTPTTTFETFPFPDVAAETQEKIATAGRALVSLRSRWLNPPEWLREDSVTFPASSNGPWHRVVTGANPDGIGVATYRWFVPADDDAEKALKRRTLTNLYNDQPAWLRDAHRALDETVFAAYGWLPDLSDDQLLAALLELNLQRAQEEQRR